MIPILIATSITCADINDLVDRAKNYPDITEEHRQEVIDLYDDVVMDLGLECGDAKADWRNGSKNPYYLQEKPNGTSHIQRYQVWYRQKQNTAD